MRIDIREILSDARARRRLFISVIIATQAREGIVTTRDQAANAYDKVSLERKQT